MLVSGRTLISLALFVVFYTALKGGYYFLSNRLQEIGFLLVFALFVYSALVAALNVRTQDLRWSWWVFSTLAFVGYTFILPGFQFAQHTGVSMIPSVFASREFLIVFLAPTLYFLYRAGYRVTDIENVFTLTVALLVFSYLFHYFRIDLPAAYFSPNPTISGMVTFDEWRGYRLKPPSFALFFASVMSPVLLVRAESGLKKLFWLITFIACIYVWYLLMARSAIAAMLLGVLLYHLWFAYKPRLGLFFLMMLAIIPALVVSTMQYLEHMKTADEGVRYKSYTIAFEQIMKYPFFGFGQQSAATLTEQQIFWYKFYSADIGIVGIAFKFGLVGAALYLSLLIYVTIRAITLNWRHRMHLGMANIILVAAIARFVGDLFRFVLSVNYVYIEGLCVASLVIALTAIYKHKFDPSNSQNGIPQVSGIALTSTQKVSV